ncbi:hypothetical protein F5144DRAFT_499211 [Chaetomium tenue]|uniref:Uncharacterized protein n=1 Tax=Chaetomium tenue TaxID=1854479 RepID=A0ACB7NVR1_9PEZI|nr:hypothetical protein F5144DRAFT_499211 [Chaetomium globosum]
MGIFDTYCAICGCSLEGATIGSNAPSALRWRHARVARKRQERESGEFDPDAYSDEEEVVEYGDDAVDEVWYPQDEGRSYDPTLVTLESMSWLEESYCLAVNPQAPGGPAYSFIGPAAFPFHPCCFSILTDVLTGSTDVAKVDKDALYGAMSERVIHYRSFLELDYGEISGIDQTWESIAGEEFSVTNPGTTPEITNLLVHCLADGRFQARSDSLKIDREIPVQDPFAGLPVEILHTILRFLSGDTLISLRRASWAVFCMTRHNSFWKWFLKHEMAWLTELRPLLSDPRPGPEPSYRALYLWLDKATAPRYGVEGPFMALANRRRIWSVCEQLSPHYFRQLQVPQQQPDYNMLQEATCRHLALISGVDQPSQSWDVQRTLFAYSQDEMKNKLFFFSVYWAEGHRLAGLSVTVDKENRTFGLTDDNMPHLTRTTMCLALGEYITAIILTLQTTDPNKHATASPYVVRMEVRGRSHPEPADLARMKLRPCSLPLKLTSLGPHAKRWRNRSRTEQRRGYPPAALPQPNPPPSLRRDMPRRNHGPHRSCTLPPPPPPPRSPTPQPPIN